jgi:hypothetical protein
VQFKALRYFAKSSTSGQLDSTAITALKLPMDDDVLEQFVQDHGLALEFQREYAELDLYGLRWELRDLSCAEIVGSSSKFDNFLIGVVDLVRREFPQTPGIISEEDWNRWCDSGTWGRAPLFLAPGFDARGPLHLVEGHHRVGMLIGLLEMSFKVRETHRCWVGKKVASHPIDWAAVLEEHHISFAEWLFDGADIEEESLRREVALKFMRYPHGFDRTLEGLMALAATELDPADGEGGTLRKNSRVQQAQLVELLAQWRRELEALAGRPLNLTP